MSAATKLISLDRDSFTETEKALFLNDFNHLAGEYFECDRPADVDITRTDEGFSVCVLFTARRIKKVNAVR